MDELGFYLLKSGIGLVISYLFYWCLFRGETFFQLNRFYLLTVLLISFTFPLINLPFGNEAQVYLTAELLSPLIIQASPVLTATSSSGPFNWVLIIYLLGTLFFLLAFLWQLIQFFLKYFGSPKISYRGFTIAVTKSKSAPASFFHILFLSDQDLHGDHLETIIDHEKYHRSQYHSLDILLIEMMAVIQWFNPFIWLSKIALRSQHEFAADRNMVKQGVDKFQYQSLLFQKGVGINVNDLMSYFNYSLLKTRIKMMNKNESKSWAGLKYFLIVPLFALFSMALFSDHQVFAQQVTKIHAQVDVMPEYPGGLNSMYGLIKRNIKYPMSARQSKTEGKIFVSFVVDKKGKVTDIKVDESPDKQNVMEELVVVGYINEMDVTHPKGMEDMETPETEVKRVISMLKPFTPGKKGGKNVDVKMTMPFFFQLG